ncbi:MAG: hypothetical protein Q9217_004035 [Psora testacea]
MTTRTLPRVCKASSAAPSRTLFTTTPFFPLSGGSPMGAFGNDLFRLLDSATADMVPAASRHPPRRSFAPRFDVREVGQEYQLQGELPGIEQKDLDIEFVDERTLVIRGRSAREETHTNAPSVGENGTQKAVAAATESGSGDNASEKKAHYRKASVEDEDYVDAGAESSNEQGAKTAVSSSAETGQSAEVAETKKAEVEPAYKYWVSERSVGEFERRFSFPGRVNQEEVQASLKNGILSVVVPKLVGKGARRIEIQ